MEKNSKGFAQIILVIILLILVSGAAYYFGIFKPKSSSILNHPTFVPPAPIITASPSPNPAISVKPSSTENWKTYTNPFYGYSFKYPTTWFLFAAGAPGVGNRDNVDSFDPKQFVGKDLTFNNGKVTLEVGLLGENSNQLPISDWFNTTDGEAVPQLNTPDYTMVGGKQAVVSYSDLQSKFPVYYVVDGTKVFVIEIDSDQIGDNFKTAQEIISTFKFPN